MDSSDEEDEDMLTERKKSGFQLLSLQYFNLNLMNSDAVFRPDLY